MNPAEIIAALKRLNVPHDRIAGAIGRDRTAATKMLAGKFLNGWRMAYDIANAASRGLSPTESLMSVVSPYRLQTFGLADAHPDQMILQVQTTEGVPLQLSMSRQDAIELERALKSYLDRPPGQAQKPHH